MEPIKLTDFLSFKSLSGLTYSPERTCAAFFVATTEYEKNEYHYQLHLLKQGKVTRLIKTKKQHHFVFEDENHVLIQLTKTKDDKKKLTDQWTIYYRFNCVSQTLEKAYEFPFEASIVKVLKGQLLLSASMRPADHVLIHLIDEKARKEHLKARKKQEAYEDIEAIPFYFNGQGFIAHKHHQLFLFDVGNHSIHAIFPSDFSVNEVVVKSSLDTLYLSGNFATPVMKSTSRLYQYDLSTNALAPLYEQDDLSIHQIFSIGETLVVAGTDMKRFGENQNPDFYQYKEGRLSLLATYGQTLGNSVGSDVRLGGSNQHDVVNDTLFFSATVDDHVELKSLDLSGKIRSIYSMDGSIDGLVILNNQCYLIGLYKQKLQEIYRLNIADDSLKQVTRFNTLALTKRYVAKPKALVVEKHGYEVKGFVLLPQGYDKRKKYPTILDIHGGPKTVYGQVYYHEMQVWASKGYIVIFANPTGSDGKGDLFSDVRGHYGEVDYQDLMDFVNRAIQKYGIDENNLFVTGGSYGGFMTNWMIGHTNRFKAAATQRSISNWISFYGTSDIGYYFAKDQTGGHPVDDYEKLWHQSPIKYLNAMQTPLLIIHSDLDYRCPIEQGMQLFTALKEKGVPSRFVWFKGETHELSRGGKPQARVKRLEEITRWFDQYQN